MSHTSLFNEKPTCSLSDYEFLQDPKDKNSRLGTGSFATVKLAKDRKNNKLIALKMVDLETSKSKAADLHNLRTEVHIHKRIDHPNIIKYHGYTQENYCIYIALDYAEKGNLYAYIHKKKSPLSSEEIFRFFYQTCLAIQYLHKNDIMHRDIKPENLLLDKDHNIKLCDFGWAAERVKDKRTTFCGTYEYMAPEVVHKRPYDYRIDIWSLGVLLYELIHKEAPYKGRSLNEIWESLSKGGVTYSPTVDPQARDLIQRILRLNPSDRPTISQILSHPWVKSQIPAQNVSVHVPVLAEKTEHIPNNPNKENHVHHHSHDISERPMTSGLSKSRKQSGWQAIQPHPVEIGRKRPVDEQQQNLESSGRAHTKSSGSLARTVLDSMDTEEKNRVNHHESIQKRNVSPSMKRSLQSIVGHSNRVTPPEQGEISSAANIPSISHILDSLSVSSTKAISHAQHPKLNKSMTPSAILTRAFTFNTMASSASSSNCQTPVIPDNFRVVNSSNRPKALVTHQTPTAGSSRQLFTPKMSNSINTGSVRGPNHVKTLTVINESNTVQRNMTENYGNTASTPAGNRVVYKGNRFIISPRVVETQTYEAVKEDLRGLEGIVSPMGLGRNRMVVKASVENSKLEDGVFPKMEEGLKTTTHNFENLMNLRPKMGSEEKLKTEGNVPYGLNFNKFVKGAQYRPKVSYNKENKSEGEKRLAFMRSGEHMQMPKIYI